MGRPAYNPSQSSRHAWPRRHVPEEGDILVVDRSIKPAHGHIMVAFVNGERLVKRLHRRHDKVALLAANPAYPPLELRDGNAPEIWGVVVGKFKRIPA